MVEFALAEWKEIYQRLPRIDAILVPGGDPGNTRPSTCCPCWRNRPNGSNNITPTRRCGFRRRALAGAWLDEFVTILQTEVPAWLSGVVYGPWCHMTIDEFRRLIPASIPIRSYPDITHSVDCQYPVPDWDIAYALTEGRETINPRPRQETDHLRPDGRGCDRLSDLLRRLQR